MEYIKFGGLVAFGGITTSLVSWGSHELLRMPLGFSQPGLINLLKVGLVSGLTGVSLVALNEKFNLVKQ